MIKLFLRASLPFLVFAGMLAILPNDHVVADDTDWSQPTLSTPYTTFLEYLKDRDRTLAMMNFTGDSSIPDESIRFNRSNSNFEEYDSGGAAWNSFVVSNEVDNLADDAVTTDKIADSQVTLGKLASDSVDSSKIVDATIVDGDIASGTITGAKIASQTVEAGNIGLESATFTPTVGTAAGSLSGISYVTGSGNHYIDLGGLVHVSTRVVFTLSSATSPGFTFDLPSAELVRGSLISCRCTVSSTTDVPCYGSTSVSEVISVVRVDGTNFATGTYVVSCYGFYGGVTF